MDWLGLVAYQGLMSLGSWTTCRGFDFEVGAYTLLSGALRGTADLSLIGIPPIFKEVKSSEKNIAVGIKVTEDS